MIVSFLIIVLGMALLYLGAELLVRAAVHISRALRIPKIIIGLTVVAFATSCPEAVASIIGQLQGKTGNIALGNVLGSNITNVGLVLGLYLLFRPCKVDHSMKWQKMPLLFFAYLLIFLVMLGGVIHPIEGAFLFLALGVYLFFQFYLTPRSAKLEEEIKLHDSDKVTRKNIPQQILIVIASGAILVLGTYLMISRSLVIANAFGISERVISISVIAFGTSLPEIATAIVAAYRKEEEIIVGTVIGSNIFNPLLVIPAATIIKPIRFSQKMLLIDFPLMVAFSLLLWLLMVLGKDRLSRLDGIILLVAYASYMTFLFL